MSLSKKGFAEIFESCLSECKDIRLKNRNLTESIYLSSERIEDNIEYRYSRYMERLVASKMSRLYSMLSVPAYHRILSMSDDELEDYKNEKLSELSGEINRLMFALEVSKTEIDKKSIKDKIEILIAEQNKLKSMSNIEVKDDIIKMFNLDLGTDVVSYDGEEETLVLENITRDKNVLTKFFEMFEEYKSLEREIKNIRGEQIIIYNDLIASNVKSELSIDELFSEESLTNMQSTIAKYLKDVVDTESSVKNDFSSRMKKSYHSIKSYDYKYSNTQELLPYNKNALENFKGVISERLYDLAGLQNDEWIRLNKKIFKTADVNERIASLCMEIDSTKGSIDLEIRKYYEKTYCNNLLFGPISSRASGKFEYSLGAKNTLEAFVKFGMWPTEAEVNSLKLAIKLNRVESEKSIIYAEQIKERMSRLYNSSLNDKKKELEELSNKITDLVGNFKNEVVLSIINEVK